MPAELPVKPPSPEFLAVLTWLTNNLWAAVCFLVVLLGQFVFGTVKKEIADLNALAEKQDKKLDHALDTLSDLGRELSEIRGELKARKPTK